MTAPNRRGVAILTAIGVLVIFGLLSSVFAAHMRLESAYTLRDAENLQAHYLAVAGVEDAIARLKSDSLDVDAYNDGWWSGESPEMIPLGNGGYTVRVSDESARINVLSASPQTLSAMVGGDKEAVAAIDNYRSAGRLFTVDDLSGADISADALSRVTELGTTLGDGKISINTAGADVIAALTGMDSNAARLVIDFRKGADGVEGTRDDFVFESPGDLAKVPGLTTVRIAPAISLLKKNSGIFRVESIGSVYVGRRVVSNERITAVLHRDEEGAIRTLSWESS